MATDEPNEVVKLLTPAEVAGIFRVDPKTVSRWVQDAERRARENPNLEPHPLVKATVFTFGGHRRYDAEVIEDMRRGKYDRLHRRKPS